MRAATQQAPVMGIHKAACNSTTLLEVMHTTGSRYQGRVVVPAPRRTAADDLGDLARAAPHQASGSKCQTRVFVPAPLRTETWQKIWEVNLGTPLNTYIDLQCYDAAPFYGIESTPTIDNSTWTMYLVANVKVHSLLAMSLLLLR